MAGFDRRWTPGRLRVRACLPRRSSNGVIWRCASRQRSELSSFSTALSSDGKTTSGILISETGNSITAADRSDMWIHEGWTTYLECLYVEYMYGKDDGLKYTNAYKSKVKNQQPIIAPRGVNATPPQDMYFKGALFINTLRSVVNDDKKWWALLHDFYQRFKYQTIMTEDIVAYFNRQTGMNLTPIFDQYLRHTALPVLELRFGDGAVSYRWQTDEAKFAMPLRVGTKDNWQIIQPTTEWKSIETGLKREQFEVATDLYYIEVRKL